MSGLAFAMLIMATAFLFAFIGFEAEAIELGVFGLMIGIVSFMIGLALKWGKNE